MSANTTYQLGKIAYGQGDLARAEALWEEALTAARAIGDPVNACYCLSHLGLAASERGDLGRAAALLSEGLALGAEPALAHHWGYLLAGSAVLGAACDATEPAARLFGAAYAAYATSTVPFTSFEGNAFTRAAQRLRAALGETAYARALEEGRQLLPAEATAEARVILAAASARAGRPLAPEGTVGGLTPREGEVLRLLVEGRSNPEIAAALFISPRTATTHVTNILAKLGVATRTEAAARAVRDGLV
jgi:DNA-binding CsgD family transcriptional regulator